MTPLFVLHGINLQRLTDAHTQVPVSFNCHRLKQEAVQMLTDVGLAKEMLGYCLAIKKNEFRTTQLKF